MENSALGPGGIEIFGCAAPPLDYVHLTQDLVRCAAGLDIATPEGARALEAEALARHMAPGPELPLVEDIMLALPGRRIAVRVYRPSVSDEPLPAMIWLHGGGMILGTLDSEDRVCRMLAKEAGCVVYNVDYRLAPEHPFPAAYEDARDSCRALFKLCPGGPIDHDRLVIAGVSAGGALAASACLSAVNEGWANPVLQLLIVPLLDYTGLYDPRAPGTDPMRDMFRKCYLPEQTNLKDWRLSAFWAQDLKKLPATFILTAELDPLREEAERYGLRLREDGVSTRLARARGLGHIFYSYSDKIANARLSLDLTADVLRQAFRETDRRGLRFRFP